MGVNKVVFGTVSIIDISDSTIEEDRIMLGDVGYGGDGERVVGKFTLEDEMSEQATLLEQIRTALRDKVAGNVGNNDNTTSELDEATLDEMMLE